MMRVKYSHVPCKVLKTDFCLYAAADKRLQADVSIEGYGRASKT